MTLVPSLDAQIVNLSNTAAALPALATARYRIDSNNWDMALFNEQPSPTAADFVTLNLGTQSQLSGDTFNFTLQNIAGQGLIWRLHGNSDLNGPAGGTVAWGTFAPPVSPANVVSHLDGELPGAFFNGINFQLRSYATGSQMALSNVAFSGATVTGAISDVAVSLNNHATSYVASLSSDTDLASFDWSLTGQIQGVKVGGAQEDVAFNLQLVAIPEPGTYALMLGAAGLFAARLRRRLTPAA